MSSIYVDVARKLLIKHEGKKNFMYKCPANKWTIGIGHNIEDRGLNETLIEALFVEDLRIAARDAVAWLGEPAWLALDDTRKAVLADFSFNLGATRLGKFVKLRAALLAKDYGAAADSMFRSKWYGQVGDRGKRLVKMMRTGEMADDV